MRIWLLFSSLFIYLPFFHHHPLGGPRAAPRSPVGVPAAPPAGRPPQLRPRAASAEGRPGGTKWPRPGLGRAIRRLPDPHPDPPLKAGHGFESLNFICVYRCVSRHSDLWGNILIYGGIPGFFSAMHICCPQGMETLAWWALWDAPCGFSSPSRLVASEAFFGWLAPVQWLSPPG